MLKHPLFLIVDGMSQAYRAHFAIRDLATSQGLPTNAVHGFALMLKRVVDKYAPDYIAVALDSSGPTVRHAQYEQYKATRKKMPAELALQIPYIRRFCDALRIPVLAIPGVEADDIIATVTDRAAAEGLHPVVVTLDKDLCQLVGTTMVLNTSKEDMIVDRDKVKELYGVEPEQIPDLLGLWGDASDNVPGAPGIGEKGARDLIQRFGSIEACLDRAAEVTNAKQRNSLLEHREQILLSKQLVTIDRNVPIEVVWSDLAIKPPDRALLVPLFKELEFTSFIKNYLPPEAALAAEVLETDDLPPVGARVYLELVGDRVAVWTGAGPVYSVPLDGRFEPLLMNPAVHKVVADLKSTLLALRRRGLDLAPPYDDPLLMAMLLFPNRGKYALPEVVFDVFGETVAPAAAGPEGKDGNDGKVGAPTAVLWIAKLYDELLPQIEREGARVYRELELPLAPVLAGMERAGIAIDADVLKGMSTEMTTQLEDLTRRIHASAGFAFNINSPRQLGEVLFERLHLPHSKKLRKSGQYSTAVEVLEELAKDYELPRLVLEYRQLTKFQSTYVDVLPTLIDPADGRLHTSFNQGGAATGRLSSTNPNLQNIPVRTELGRKIRRAFIPQPGWRFVAADYSQVELRILAHLSGDEKLIEAFAAGEDVHRRTAAEVLGAPIEAVTPEQRERAKAVNFGIVYGQTAFGLAQQLGISNDEAADFIARYFQRYRGVQDYIAACLAEARESGVTRTLFGRVRQHPEINVTNGMRRSMAERMAINSPIQGTAADIIKLAMIRIDAELGRNRLRTRMTLQVHDELIFEAPADESEVGELVRDVMQNVVQLRVPLTVDLKQGQNWEELG